MPKIIEKKIDELFDAVNGNSKYTKSYCREHAGQFVVYTGTTIGVFGKLDKADYVTPNLTFTTDGENAGTIEYITDVGYCIGGHRTILRPIVDKLNLLYFKFVLQPIFYNKVKRGDVPSLHFNQIKHIKIGIPANSDGSFDLKAQEELALKYQDIENKKRLLIEKIEYLKNSRIIFNNLRFNFVEVSLNTLVTHHNGNSNYTKEFCREHAGIFPVFSANNNAPIGYIDKADYNGEFLTYSKNGCAGYISIMNGLFSINGDRCVLKLNNEYKGIDISYLKYYLEPIFRANIKGRIGVNGKNEYTKLNSTMIKKLDITIPIPIKADGSFDLEKQQELAQKYATIDSIKEELYNKIQNLTKVVVY